MTKAISAKGNLNKAKEIREAGASNSFELMPDLQARLHELWYKGESIRSIRRTLTEEFGQVYTIPSLDSFNLIS